MVAITPVKIYKVGSRHSMNLSSNFVHDSAFPFSVGEDLEAKIEGQKIVIEKMSEEAKKARASTSGDVKPKKRRRDGP